MYLLIVGFKEITACCGSGQFRGSPSCGGKRGRIPKHELCDNPDEYLLFDFVHLSEKANMQIAELFWSGIPDVAGPYNLKTQFELKLLNKELELLNKMVVRIGSMGML